MDTRVHRQPGDGYYSVVTLADKWGCSPDLVYSLLRQKKLRAFKLGHDWRISEQARLDYENGVTEKTEKTTKTNLRGRLI